MDFNPSEEPIMSMRYNQRGRRISTTQHTSSDVRVQVLSHTGWEDVAYVELQKLTIAVAGMFQQLKNEPIAEKLATALTSLEEASEAIAHLADQNPENDDPELGMKLTD
jgi:hypothetical protein